MASEITPPSAGPKETSNLIHMVFERGITEEERDARYDQSSENYDQNVLGSHYCGPVVAAETIASCYSSTDIRPDIHILDIGAGTGLVGEELLKRGFKLIDGLDPSPGMMVKAKEKVIYRKFFNEAISGDPLDLPTGSYDVITVVGSHGPNHIQNEATLEMMRLLKPNGYLCIVTRMENFKSVKEYKDSFFPMCDNLEKEGRWKMIKRDSCSYMDGVEGICVCYQLC